MTPDEINHRLRQGIYAEAKIQTMSGGRMFIIPLVDTNEVMIVVQHEGVIILNKDTFAALQVYDLVAENFSLFTADNVLMLLARLISESEI